MGEHTSKISEGRAGTPARAGFWPGPLPGFRLTLGFTIACVSLVVILPLSALAVKSAGLSFAEFWQVISSPRALASYKLSFGGALVAAFINAVAGVLLAWVLVRYRFPGRAIVDALIDLPLALPTAVAGVALTAIYAKNGIVGGFLEAHGISVAFTKVGVILAMVFVGLPFAVRTVQPVLMDLDGQVEEAAAVLGASRLTTFRKIILPVLLPPLAAGFALAFARAVGEYGSVVFISGNLPLETEIVPLLIVNKLEQFKYAHATSLAMVMLAGSFLTLLAVNFLQARKGRSHG